MLQLDHVAFAAETLEAGSTAAEAVLGVSLQPGGKHAHFGTHNRLLGLANGLYFEVIAADPKAPDPGHPRWFDLDRFHGRPRLTNWICRTDDLAAAVAQFPQAGTPVAMSRGDLHWKMAVPESGVLPFDNMFPALIEWQCEAHPANILPPSGCRLRRLMVRHPEVAMLQKALAGVLKDDRVIFASGAAGLRAEIETPAGVRVL